MSQSPNAQHEFEFDSQYAAAARQLNKLVRSGKSYSGHERNCCYLNIAGKRFANASIVSGFDFAEDGRAVAACDWDQDGDLDYWVSNRTAPRLRFMQNRGANHESGNYLAILLQGTRSNRDAIGARVELTLDDNNNKRARTVRCGEGFLASGSKRVHFGLGDLVSVSNVHVRWPDGTEESFGPAAVNQLIHLTEGTGIVQTVSRKAQLLEPAPVTLPPQTMATENWLTEPVICPPLLYQDPAGQIIDAAATGGKPVVVTLWASWCQPCLDELTEWSRSFEQLAKKDVRLLAICADAFSEAPAEAAEAFMASISFQGERGTASPQLLNALQHFHNTVYDHHRPLPMPTTILIDADGKIRALYKGRFSIQSLLSDVHRIAIDDRTLPLPGEWLGIQGPHRLHQLIEALYADQHVAEATAYVERFDDVRQRKNQIHSRLFLAQSQKDTQKVESLRQLLQVLKLDSQNTSAHQQLGLLMARAGRTREALHHFEQAVVHAEVPSARSRYNYGKSLRLAGFAEPALEQLQLALTDKPNFAAAHEQVGLIHASQRDFEQAAGAFQKAQTCEPQVARHSINLAMAWNAMQRYREAWLQVEPIVQMDGAPNLALLTGAQSLANLGETERAVELLEAFLVVDPDSEPVKQQIQALRNRISGGGTE